MFSERCTQKVIYICSSPSTQLVNIRKLNKDVTDTVDRVVEQLDNKDFAIKMYEEALYFKLVFWNLVIGISFTGAIVQRKGEIANYVTKLADFTRL